MAFGGYVVEALIRFNTNGIATMERLSSATNRAAINQALLTGNVSKQEAAWLRNASAIEANARAHARLKASIAGSVAAAGGITIFEGVKAAAEFQRAMASVAINLPQANQDAMRRMVIGVSSMTAQSATTIANELAVLGSSGIKDPRLIRSVFPLFAKAADVGWLSPKHLDPEHTVAQLAQFSHIFGVYQGKPLENMVNSAMKMMSMQPEGLQAMLTQGRLFVGGAMARGVPMDEIFRQFMLMGQTGFLRGRGGSGVENFMDYLSGAESLTNHMSKVRRAAFMDMSHAGVNAGIGAMFDENGRLKFVDKEGNLHLEAAERYLAQLAKYMDKGQFSNDVVNAFGKQGRNFILVATRPEVQAQFERNKRAFNVAPNIDQQWSTYMNTFLGQLSVAGTNLKNVLIGIFLPTLPALTKVTHAIGDGLGNIAKTLQAHPALGVMIAGFLGTLTAAASAAAIGFTVSAMSIPRNLAQIAASIEGFAATTQAEAAQINAASATAAGGLGTMRLAIMGLLPYLATAALVYAAYNGVKSQIDFERSPMGKDLAKHGIDPGTGQYVGTSSGKPTGGWGQLGDWVYHMLHQGGAAGGINVQSLVIQSNADSLQALTEDIKRNLPHVLRKGGLQTSPRGMMGALDNFLPGGAY